MTFQEEFPETYGPAVLERLRGDEGSAARRIAVGVGIGAAIVVGAGIAVKNWLPGLPDQVASPKDSRIIADQKYLTALVTGCRTAGAYDIRGSSAITTYDVPEFATDYVGNGNLVRKGIVVKQMCIGENGMTYQEKTVAGKRTAVVSLRRSAISQEVFISAPDTTIISIDAPTNQAVKGAVNALTGVSRFACTGLSKLTNKDSFNYKSKTYDCDTLNTFSAALNTKDEEIRNTFEYDLTNFVRVGCAAKAWPAEFKAIQDSYKTELKAKKVDPARVKFQIVDDQGKPTTQLPDFSNNALQKLIDAGVISDEVKDVVKLKYATKICRPMTAEDYEKQKSQS